MIALDSQIGKELDLMMEKLSKGMDKLKIQALKEGDSFVDGYELDQNILDILPFENKEELL